MDSKRLILFVVLTFAVFVAWGYFFPAKQTQQTQQPATQQQAQSQAPGQSAPPSTEAGPPPEPIPSAAPSAYTGKTVVVDTPLYEARINTQGGIVESFMLKKYKVTIKADSPLVDLISPEAAAKAPMGLILNGTATWNAAPWQTEGGDLNLAGDDAGTLRLTTEIQGVRLVRDLTFHADSYIIEENLTLENGTQAQYQGRVSFTMASPSLSGDNRYNRTFLAYFGGGELEKEAGTDTDDISDFLAKAPSVEWGAVMDNYFLLAVAPEAEGARLGAKYVDSVYRLALERSGVLVGPGSSQTLTTAYYLGPKDTNALKGAPNNLNRSIDFGFFSFIAEPMLMALNWFYGYVGNYGVAIILLTVVIKIIFWPLSQKSYKSMEKMKRIQPMMAKIREKYKDNREKMNAEMMQLYKTYKVNPAGGCLPMVLQIPVFLGLYQALLGAIELRHAPFITHLPFTDMIWLADLSAKDPYYITPLIMGATMFLQQKLTPSPGDPTQAKIMLFMPIIFTFVFLNFPSGLVVYWLVNNVLSIGQQWWMIRKA